MVDKVPGGQAAPLVADSGSLDARLLIIGEAGGNEEFEQGKCWVGPSGRMLWRALAAAGIYRHEVYATNVVQLERPALKSGKPSAAQIRAEWERVDEVLDNSKAEIVMMVGGTPFQRVTGIKKGITTMRGYVLRPEDCRPVGRRRLVRVGEYKTSRRCGQCKPDTRCDRRGRLCAICGGDGWKYQKGDPKYAPRTVLEPPALPPNCKYLIPTLHPSGILRARWATWPALVADCLRIGRALRGELDLIEKVEYYDHLMPLGSTVAWDIETDGNTVLCLGVADGGCVCSVPIDRDVVVYIRRALLDPDHTIICHNLAFDIPRLCDLVGITIDDVAARLEDTMLEAQLLCPDLPKGLEKVAPLYLDVTPWKDTADEDNPAYNAKDVQTTFLVRNRMEGLLDGQREEYDAILRAVPSLWKATRRGLRVDLRRVSVWRPQLEKAVVEANRRWVKAADRAGKGVPSIGSNPQLVRYLYFGLGLPPKYGKEGQLTVEEAALGELMYDHPEHTELLQTILDYRKASSDLSKWGSLTCDRLHPSYLPSSKEEGGNKGQGASTGRIQARDPNIMNLDRANRDIIIPDRGMFLGYVDWSQAEARVEAVSFDDDALLAAIDADLHTYIGERMGIDRVRAKNFWYGTGRGAGPRKLKKVMWANGFRDATENDCRQFQVQLGGLFPNWARGRQEMTDLVRARCTQNSPAWLDTPFGRRRYWYVKPGLPDVIGFYPQATVAGMLLRVLPEVDKHVELLAPMHDAVLFQTDSEDAVAAVVDIFNREWPEIEAGFVVPADAKCGGNWKEVE